MTDLDLLRTEAATCTRCPIYEHATATVFGEGTSAARLVLVGEQPGDQEDRRGRPFVGPAGQLLDRALADAAIDRGDVYVTNAVKHFKWTPRGPRRIHQSPSAGEVTACKPWLEGELGAVSPELVVALGATAGKALIGPSFRVTAQRGQALLASLGTWSGMVVGTIHPSAILRLQEPDEREAQYQGLVGDLRTAAGMLA